MTDEEIQEYNDSLRLFSGITLPGVIGRASSYISPEEIAEKAFDIAEAMIVEYNKRKNVSES